MEHPVTDPAAPSILDADEGKLRELVSDALAVARKQGASAAEASASTSTGLAVNVRLGEVETVEHTRDRGLGITVYFGQRKGSASTTDFEPEALRQTVEAACAIARYTSEDEYAGLADAELMATAPLELDLYHPWQLSAEGAIELGVRTEQAARDVDQRITNSEGAGVNHGEGIHIYGNTHGFLGGGRSTRHSLSCVVIAEDEGGMQRDYWYTVARRPDALEDPESVGRQAGERTVRRLGSRQIDTQTVPVLFAAELAGGLVGHFLGAVRGSNLYRRSSFLLDRLGDAVFPSFVRIHEQPHLPQALGSAWFDGEGVATGARDLVTDGVLKGYILDSYSARKLDMRTTGNADGVHNLTVEPSPDALDLEGLLARMGTGLLVTELMGMGVKLTTGDYSRGASGFWVENGEIVYPVEEITIAGNLSDMYHGIQAIGADIDLRGNVRCGSVLLDEMTVAGQ